MTKTESVNKALREMGVDSPARDVRDYVKKKFNIDIPEKSMHVTISQERKKIRAGGLVRVVKNNHVPQAAVKAAGYKEILELVRGCDNLEACLSMIRQLKGMDLNEVESVVAQIAKASEIAGDKNKAIEMFEVLRV